MKNIIKNLHEPVLAQGATPPEPSKSRTPYTRCLAMAQAVAKPLPSTCMQKLEHFPPNKYPNGHRTQISL